MADKINPLITPKPTADHGQSAVRWTSRAIASDLRKQVVSGSLDTGSQLPTRTELIAHYRTSSATLQQALSQLKREGFLNARKGQGTFVVYNPPHLFHIGLVFRGDALTDVPGGSSFWKALAQTALLPGVGRRFGVTIYRNVDKNRTDGDYQKLVADAAADRLAGVILTEGWAIRPLMSEVLRIPCVSFDYQCTIENSPNGYWLSVDLDMLAFFRTAMERLAREGRRRVGVLLYDHIDERFPAAIHAMADEFGLEVRPHWVQGLSVRYPRWAGSAAAQLVSGSNGLDGLIIADDHLVPHATAALAGMGVRVPGELEVIAHCNYPLLPRYSVTPTFLGFHADQILDTCFDVISRVRRGGEGLSVTRVAPAFSGNVAYHPVGVVTTSRGIA